MLHGKKIVLGITGSIAAYKTAFLVRSLIKSGAAVRIVMTSAASAFVSPLTLSTLSRNPVLTELFEEENWNNHVELGRWADLMVIAPLSCNTLGKMAHGRCDNLLLAVYLSATCPVMAAPAMDEDMWKHPSTRDNLLSIAAHGCRILDVGFGELASGLTGHGRMAEPEEIERAIHDFFRTSSQLQGKKALVTAGPTHESIDPVRFIGNQSSGKMGYAIAEELASRGADVTLVSGPVSLNSTHKNIKIIRVMSAEDMYRECTERSKEYDIAVMAAAVADYRPAETSGQKIKKSDGSLTIELIRTKDILASLGKLKNGKQVLVGFALETQQEENNARKKLEEKNADLIILNSLNDAGAGFGHDTNQVTLFYRTGEKKKVELKPKKELAKDIVDSIIEMK